MKLPNFICVGANKAGTTSLQNILIQHPRIFLPEEKEIHFFDNNENFSQGIEWYEKYYTGADDSQHLAVGDISPCYMFYDYVPERILQTLGKDVKLIFTLRNPMQRAYSDYLHNFRRGFIDDTDFLSSIETDLKRLKNNTPKEFKDRYNSFVSRGLYGRYIKSYLKFFPKGNMLFLLFEDDFLKNRENAIYELQNFLGVEPLNLELNGVKNNKAYVPKSRGLNKMVYGQNIVKKIAKSVIPSFTIRQKIRDKISSFNSDKNIEVPCISRETETWLYRDFYKDDIAELENIIDRDLSSWKIE